MTRNVVAAVREFATIEEKLNIPPRPKRPLTPFFRFLANNREQALKQNKDLTAMSVVQVLSKQWSNVDEALKEKLTAEYKKDKAEYTKKIAQYEIKLTDEQREGLRAAKKVLVEDKEKRAHKKVSQMSQKMSFLNRMSFFRNCARTTNQKNRQRASSAF